MGGCGEWSSYTVWVSKVCFNILVYLRDGSGQTIARAATLR